MTKEECELSIMYLEGIKENYIEGDGYERHPLPEYYAIKMAIKSLEHTKNEEPAYWYKKGIYPGWLYCSNCNEPWSFNTGTPSYCPCCGKRMVKPQESKE